VRGRETVLIHRLPEILSSILLFLEQKAFPAPICSYTPSLEAELREKDLKEFYEG
jgi:hypothetical protein